MAMEVEGTWWLEVGEVARFERISRMEVYNRMKPGDAHPLIWKEKKSFAENVPKREPVTGYRGFAGRGRIIYTHSMTADGQERFKLERLKALASPPAGQAGPEQAPTSASSPTSNAQSKPGPAGRIGPGPAPGGQLALLPQEPLDLAIAELRAKLQHDEVRYNVILLRHKVIAPTFNHDFMAVYNHPSVSSYFKALAPQFQLPGKACGVHPNSFWRWRKTFKELLDAGKPLEALLALGDARPGPPPGTGTILTPDIKLRIQDRWEGLSGFRLTRNQIVRDIQDYVKEKQRILGPVYAYSLPMDARNPKDPYRSTIIRWINRELRGDANPRRNGPEALKIGAGYIDRHYDDELAGDCWCIDEWEIDAAFYNAENRSQLINYGHGNPIAHILSIIDERTTCILKWAVTLELERATLDLTEELLRETWLPQRLVSDRAKRFRQLVRGHLVVSTRGDLVKKLQGPLGILGVQPRGSEEKNPRANRIERMHGIYAPMAREFGVSWKEPLKGKHEEREIDRVVARHLKEHCNDGTCGPQLVSIQEAVGIVGQWVEKINLAETKAKGCKGLTRLAAFRQFSPPAEEIARRRLAPELIDLAFAEHHDRTVQMGGVIELEDKMRYSSQELGAHVGEKLHVVRYRRDRSRIIVTFDDGRATEADERIPVGTDDPEGLAREIAKLQHARKLIAPEAVERFRRNISTSDAAPLAVTPLTNFLGAERLCRRPAAAKTLTSEEIARAAMAIEEEGA